MIDGGDTVVISRVVFIWGQDQPSKNAFDSKTKDKRQKTRHLLMAVHISIYGANVQGWSGLADVWPWSVLLCLCVCVCIWIGVDFFSSTFAYKVLCLPQWLGRAQWKVPKYANSGKSEGALKGRGSWAFCYQIENQLLDDHRGWQGGLHTRTPGTFCQINFWGFLFQLAINLILCRLSGGKW